MRCVAGLPLKTSEAVIQQQSDLDRLVADMDAVIGLDTEFHRRKTFFPKPCVLQIGTSSGSYIVDLLAPLNLRELETALFSEDRVKVTHAPREDLELLHLMFGAELPNLVDVQLAHAFLSTDASLNYSSLVEHYLDHPLKQNKRLTQSDWRKRPLTLTQIKYAIDDVRFLIPLWDEIRALLLKLGRLSWFREEMQHYFQPVYEFALTEIAAIPAQSDWSPTESSVYFGLLEWRERTARSRNLPRERVLAHRDARMLVEHHDQSFEFFREHFRGQGRKLHRLISRVKNGSTFKNIKEFPKTEKRISSNRELFQHTKEPIKRVVAKTSDSLTIAPETLGRSSQISGWISHYDEHENFPPTFGNWREELIGTELREILNP